MEIQTQILKEVVVLELSGRMDPEGAPIFEDRMAQVFQQGCYRLILDAKNLEYISSVGFRALVSAVKEVSKNNGRLVFGPIRKPVKDFLEMAGMLKEVPHYPTIDEAIANC